jgi:hypothetical protein
MFVDDQVAEHLRLDVRRGAGRHVIRLGIPAVAPKARRELRDLRDVQTGNAIIAAIVPSLTVDLASWLCISRRTLTTGRTLQFRPEIPSPWAPDSTMRP